MSSQVSDAPRQGLNPRQAETVERLLVAGLEEVRAVGHEAVTVRTVAQRAGVSPATAYTYLASKNHLFAELFWRHISAEPAGDPLAEPDGDDVLARVRATTRDLLARIAEEPALADAVTPALLGTDPDVARLRLRIGSAYVARFEAALRDPARPEAPVDAAVLDVLVLTLTGALLQAGMGLLTYDDVAARLDAAAAVVVGGAA